LGRVPSAFCKAAGDRSGGRLTSDGTSRLTSHACRNKCCGEVISAIQDWANCRPRDAFAGSAANSGAGASRRSRHGRASDRCRNCGAVHHIYAAGGDVAGNACCASSNGAGHDWIHAIRDRRASERASASGYRDLTQIDLPVVLNRLTESVRASADYGASYCCNRGSARRIRSAPNDRNEERQLTGRVNAVQRIIPHIGVEVQIVLVPHGVSLQELAPRAAVRPFRPSDCSSCMALHEEVRVTHTLSLFL
jgi:hypothetical protein